MFTDIFHQKDASERRIIETHQRDASERRIREDISDQTFLGRNSREKSKRRIRERHREASRNHRHKFHRHIEETHRRDVSKRHIRNNISKILSETAIPLRPCVCRSDVLVMLIFFRNRYEWLVRRSYPAVWCVQVGFRVEDLQFNPELVCRGLVIDKELGNMIKVDRYLLNT